MTGKKSFHAKMIAHFVKRWIYFLESQSVYVTADGFLVFVLLFHAPDHYLII